MDSLEMMDKERKRRRKNSMGRIRSRRTKRRRKSRRRRRKSRRRMMKRIQPQKLERILWFLQLFQKCPRWRQTEEVWLLKRLHRALRTGCVCVRVCCSSSADHVMFFSYFFFFHSSCFHHIHQASVTDSLL